MPVKPLPENLREKFLKANREMLEEESKLNLLLLGNSGSGKTYSLHTAPRPIYIDSFDPKGFVTLQPWLNGEDFFVDRRWEQDDPFAPTVYAKWKGVTEDRFRTHFFDYFATYVVDSSTLLSMSMMNYVLSKRGKAGEIPERNKDYNPQKYQLINMLHALMLIPCNFILTGHLHMITDPITEAVMYRYDATGVAKEVIPALFQEIWVMQAKGKGPKTERSILTESTGTYLAKSRLSSKGFLDREEPPDIQRILDKVEQRRKGAK